ncbi:MAG: DUF951 domain-containing protein [Exiguobacterium sp.]|uniref:Bacterial protein of uncharacterized function (DUF951) n=2 Tax=Exiguobacterium TaxID=33986 RepID=A0A377FYX7_9BACL|nr:MULTISPECIES: DUF951 domain-containing protein [Exiguobacterium]MDX5324048.1 DUF951 domain-containing protein [Exiguobacterium sp.]KDN58684.1 hypothetical protein DI14_06750 [Exiguobacterium sp. AB2]MCT4795913.1 DUF951 domain-containing protein [Exiguobacterium alkaliphilum]MDX5425875.1 DUF951 domain-containing protein [Exiguobacterium sp.]MDX6773266.1 DUF951 domain-containing protein [Exiguobacterium sp.]
MQAKSYELNDYVEMKKPHACKTNRWQVTRVGMDIRIKCQGCGASVLMPRRDFDKRLKKVLKEENAAE